MTQINLGIRPVFAVRMKKAWALTTHWVHSKDWSDWVDAQADLSLRWEQLICWFCHVVALIKVNT